MEPVISIVFSLCMFVNGSLDGHMMTDGLSKCLKAKQEAAEKKQAEKALDECPIKIGDNIAYVCEVIVKPTHVQRGSRMVRMRYEAEKKFYARECKVQSIVYVHWILINGVIALRDICDSIKDARAQAEEQQKAYDEHVEFSRRYRS